MYLFTLNKKYNLISLVVCSAMLITSSAWAQPTITSDYIGIGQKFRIVLYETNLNIDNQLVDIINAKGPIPNLKTSTETLSINAILP